MSLVNIDTYDLKQIDKDLFIQFLKQSVKYFKKNLITDNFNINSLNRLISYLDKGKLNNSKKLYYLLNQINIYNKLNRSLKFNRDFEIYFKDYDDKFKFYAFNESYLKKNMVRFDFDGSKYFFWGVGRKKKTINLNYSYGLNGSSKLNVLYSLLNYTGVDLDFENKPNYALNKQIKIRYPEIKRVLTKTSTNGNTHLLLYAINFLANNHFKVRSDLADDVYRLNLDVKRFYKKQIFNRLWEKKIKLRFRKNMQMQDFYNYPKGKCHFLVQKLMSNGLIDGSLNFIVKHRFNIIQKRPENSHHTIGYKRYKDYLMFFDFTAGQYKGLNPQIFFLHVKNLKKVINMPSGWVYEAVSTNPNEFYKIKRG